MTAILKLEENTQSYKGHAHILESLAAPGMILVEIAMTEKVTGLKANAGIRLTANQARLMASMLNSMADQMVRR